VTRWAERLLAAAAALLFVLGPCLALNPVWGDAQPAEGWPIVNTLLVAFAFPGALAAGYAWKLSRDGRKKAARVLAVVAALALPMWASFEVRRAFRGPYLNQGFASNAEGWAMSAIWLLSAAALLVLGFRLKRGEIRWVALGLLALTTLKVFLFDLSGLEGLWRALSFLGLGGALLAIAALYQKVILPAGRAERPAA
jgi:uncharacterized membrane protein